MSEKQAKMEVRVDGYTRVCLTLIAVLLTVMVVGLWTDGVNLAPSARAADDGFGDTGGRQKAMVAAQEQTNAKLDELMKLLRSGEVKVQVAQSDAKSSGGGDSAPSKPK